jgi:glycosyltransferase involved in cell wall biosynthesis
MGLEYGALRGTFAPVPDAVREPRPTLSWPRSVAAVVPARDEAERIAEVVRTMPGSVDRIVVVDDGSVDDTGELAQRADARVTLVRHARSRGVGAALSTGYREAFARGADVAVVMAGDGQMDPADLPALLAAVGRAPRPLYVKGTRLCRSRVLLDMPTVRLVGNVVYTLLSRAVTGLSITDSQCGYTAITRQAAERLDLSSLWPRYGYPNDLLARCAARGVEVIEVPVRAVYRGEKSGIRARDAVFTIPYALLSSRWRS